MVLNRITSIHGTAFTRVLRTARLLILTSAIRVPQSEVAPSELGAEPGLNYEGRVWPSRGGARAPWAPLDPLLGFEAVGFDSRLHYE